MRFHVAIPDWLLRVTREVQSYLELYAYELWDPELYGPGPSRVFRVFFKISLVLSSTLLVVFTILSLANIVKLPLVLISLAPLVLAYIAPHAWRLLLGLGVDKELPILLAYLIPYTRTPVNIADLIAMANSGNFYWVRFEASRLKYLLDLGYDPLTALRKLSETTPSRSLSSIIKDYVNAQSLGVSRSDLTLLLFKYAMDSVRDQWRSHIGFGGVIAEGIVAAIISMVALAPLVLLGGGYPVILIALPLVVAPAGAFALLATRPALGEYRLSYFELLLTITVPFIAVILNYKISLEAGLAYLIGMTLVVEAIALGFKRLNEMALKELRLAIEESKLGLMPEERLARAERVAGGVIKAIVSASRIAGTMGLGEALNQILTLVEEARRQVRAASLQASILALLSVASLPIAIYALNMLKIALTTGGLSVANAAIVDSMVSIVAITSPLVALPASVLQRGWLISPIYPLLAQTLVMITLNLI